MNFINSKKSKVIALLMTAAMLISCFAFMQTSNVNAAAAKKAPYSGGSLKNVVFYIAVDVDGNGSVKDSGDAVYYYTLAEIKAAGEEVAYHYGNHGQGETANVKGAKLKTLLDNTTGVEFQDSWKIQCMEEDAYHAMGNTYIDTIGGLTDPNGVGNGSGYQGPAETIIGYANKTIFDAPDENNVNDKNYIKFTDYEREASAVRAYRQTSSANSSVMKMLKGVVITSADAVNINGKAGYTLSSIDSKDQKIADDYVVKGFPEGIAWEATPNINVPWATLNDIQEGNFNGSGKKITIGADAAQVVNYTYTETPFFSVTQNGKTRNFKRTNLAAQGGELPASNVKEGTTYEFFGYNKPMYVRYQGVWLNDYVDTPNAGEKVLIVKEDGKTVDITNRVDDFFVAYYYSQSKSSSNISNGKRVPLNYDYSVLVDSASAPVEYSNDIGDYTVESGKTPTIYKNAKIVVKKVAKAPAKTTVSLKKYKKTAIKVSWKNVSGETGYQIYRSLKKSSGFKKIGTVAANKTSFINKKLKKGKTYYYKVRAYQKVGSDIAYAPFSAVKALKR